MTTKFTGGLKKLVHVLALATTLLGTVPVAAQTTPTPWRNGVGISYSATPIIGDGGNRVSEIFTADQGGDPPATLIEPAEIGEAGHYTRSQWIKGTGVQRLDQGEAKFRIACKETPFRTVTDASVDPIVYPGLKPAGHPHSFAGNIGVNENSTYASMRNSPASSCQGGPLWSQGYWHPQLQYEVSPGVWVEVAANLNTFYYHADYDKVKYLIRLFRGLGFIAGVKPGDRLNTAILNEIPNGQGWDKSLRYNGWNGWGCYKIANSDGATTAVFPDGDSDADIAPSGWPRQLRNSDGTDPWKSGSCEPGAGYHLILMALVDAPDCWDGTTLQGDGRGPFRYPIRATDGDPTDACPDYSWRLPIFEGKTEFVNLGAAWRQKLRLSSDAMFNDPRGSTWHIDWKYALDDWAFLKAFDWCMGGWVNGVAGHPLTCGSGTISPTEVLLDGAAPQAGLSYDPVLTYTDLSTGPSKNLYGPIPTGTVIPTMDMKHH